MFADDEIPGLEFGGWCEWCGAPLHDPAATKCPTVCSWNGWRSDESCPPVASHVDDVVKLAANDLEE